MAGDVFVPCREWLGVEPADLASPHRLLGIGESESDPIVIVRAADRRLAALRRAPVEHAADRDALMAQVEAARDALLAAAVCTRAAATAPPPVPCPVAPLPPPVPPAVPAATAAPTATVIVPPPVPPAATPPVPAADAPGFAGDTIHIGRSRVVPRRRSDGAGMALGLTAIVIAAGASAVSVAWPHLRQATTVARRSDDQQKPRPQLQPAAPQAEPSPRPKPATEPKPAPQPEPKPASAPAPKPRPASKPQPAPEPQPASPPPPAAMDPSPPETSTVDPEEVRAAVGVAIGKGFASLRRQDFAAARREFDAAADRALDDQQATDRLQRWRQLTMYAEGYPEYRDRALASAASTAATYDLGSRQIAVVEFTAREFIYRDSRRPGQNLRVPRDAIPPDIELALVEQWFARDGRAANHLFLGAAALARREPDLAVARREWRAAAEGGEPHGDLLLGILDDPAVSGR